MAQWKVSTRDKKSVEEHEIWEKDGRIIVRISGFRWGTWTVTTDDEDPPEFDRDENDCVDMYDCGYDSELDMLDDGWYGEVRYPDDCDQEEIDRMNEMWDEEGYDAWEAEGWTQTETECWAWGEFDVEKID